MSNARIAIDAMGGDRAPKETVRGAVDAVKQDETLEVVLVGREPDIRAELEIADLDAAQLSRLHVHHAANIVAGGEPAMAGYRKEDNSIRVSMELAKADDVHGVVAAGNTAATVTAAVTVLKRLPHVGRPGIAVPLPTASGQSIL